MKQEEKMMNQVLKNVKQPFYRNKVAMLCRLGTFIMVTCIITIVLRWCYLYLAWGWTMPIKSVFALLGCVLGIVICEYLHAVAVTIGQKIYQEKLKEKIQFNRD